LCRADAGRQPIDLRSGRIQILQRIHEARDQKRPLPQIRLWRGGKGAELLEDGVAVVHDSRLRAIATPSRKGTMVL